MRLLSFIFMGLFGLTGCLSGSVFGPPNQIPAGLGSDLRVFLNDTCLEDDAARSGLEGRSFGVAAALGMQVAKGVGQVAFKSLGRYLEEKASPDLATATDVATGYFYEPQSPDDFGAERYINPNIRCIHIVRNGFSGGGLRGVPDSQVQRYRKLGITGRPSFYALLQIEQSVDGSPYFRAEMKDLVIDRFEQAGAEGGRRDVLILMEYGDPGSARTQTIDQDGVVEQISNGAFAIGGVQLSNARRDFYPDEGDLIGRGTAWMSVPGVDGPGGQAPFNLYVDVVEVKRGNPLLADIGRTLQSPAIVETAGAAIVEAIDKEPRRRERAQDRFNQKRRERTLVRVLEDELREFRLLRQDPDTPERDLLDQRRRVEDALDDLDEQAELEEWVTTWPAGLYDEGQRAVRR